MLGAWSRAASWVLRAFARCQHWSLCGRSTGMVLCRAHGGSQLLRCQHCAQRLLFQAGSLTPERGAHATLCHLSRMQRQLSSRRRVFRSSALQLCAIHAKRVTIFVKDMQVGSGRGKMFSVLCLRWRPGSWLRCGARPAPAAGGPCSAMLLLARSRAQALRAPPSACSWPSVCEATLTSSAERPGLSAARRVRAAPLPASAPAAYAHSAWP